MKAKFDTDFAVSKRAQINRRFAVAITVGGPGKIVVEWIPEMPRKLSQSEIRRYREARDAALREFANHLGGAILLVEL